MDILERIDEYLKEKNNTYYEKMSTSDIESALKDLASSIKSEKKLINAKIINSKDMLNRYQNAYLDLSSELEKRKKNKNLR